MAADLVLWSADPSAGAAVLSDPRRHVALVIKGGLLAAAPAGCGADAVNAALAGG